MDRLTIVLEQRKDWARLFDADGFGLFVPGDSPPAVDSEVRVDLTVRDGGLRIIFKGKVLSIRGDADGEAGCQVGLSVEDREKVNFMNGFVRGGLLNLREMRRLPLRLPVSYTDDDGRHNTVCRDINEEGIFVLTESPLAEGTRIQIELSLPDHADPMPFVGTVTHTVVVEDEDIPGMGLTFVFDSGGADRFTKIIDELENQFYKGELPDDVIT